MSAKTTKKKSRFGETVKKTGSKAKSYAGKKYQSVKSSFGRYKDDLDNAYSIGYRKGWEDAYAVPKRVGAKSKAAKGYKHALCDRKKSDKYVAILNKGKD